jgi:26S proteasome regulatory subunit N1
MAEGCTGLNTLAGVDSARENLAGTFVNTFVNAGFGNNKLMVEAEEGNSWVYKNKEHGSSFHSDSSACLNPYIQA